MGTGPLVLNQSIVFRYCLYNLLGTILLLCMRQQAEPQWARRCRTRQAMGNHNQDDKSRTSLQLRAARKCRQRRSECTELSKIESRFSSLNTYLFRIQRHDTYTLCVWCFSCYPYKQAEEAGFIYTFIDTGERQIFEHNNVFSPFHFVPSCLGFRSSVFVILRPWRRIV